jgi:hypothetical protein
MMLILVIIAAIITIACICNVVYDMYKLNRRIV